MEYRRQHKSEQYLIVMDGASEIVYLRGERCTVQMAIVCLYNFVKIEPSYRMEKKQNSISVFTYINDLKTRLLVTTQRLD